jgi:hypothetical protein
MTLKDLTHRPTLPFTISAVDADITVDSYTSSSGFAQYLVTFFLMGASLLTKLTFASYFPLISAM